VPRSLDFAAWRAKLRRERKRRDASLGMTVGFCLQRMEIISGVANRGLADLELDGLGEGFAGSVGDSEGVGGGFFRRQIEATEMRRPDLTFGRIKGHGFRAGDIVAKLRGLAAMNDGGRDIEGANGEFVPAELLEGGAIIVAALLGGFLGVALLKGAIGFVAGKN
jgi:hypothetical protein